MWKTWVENTLPVKYYSFQGSFLCLVWKYACTQIYVCSINVHYRSTKTRCGFFGLKTLTVITLHYTRQSTRLHTFVYKPDLLDFSCVQMQIFQTVNVYKSRRLWHFHWPRMNRTVSEGTKYLDASSDLVVILIRPS